MRVLFFVTLCVGLSACSLGRPPAPVLSAIAPVPPAALFTVPPTLELSADLLGLTPRLAIATATITELEEIEELAEGALQEDPSDRDPVFPDERASDVRPLFFGMDPISFDIPMHEDPRVEEWIQYLTGRGREWSVKWLARSTRYAPIFWQVIDRYGLPRDLVFLSMIESGFSPKAYSWAHAAGPWQFMPATGRQYGLEVGFWVDQRRDFERATDAAARHLRDLNKEFGDWYLAFAAYNAGAGRIRRAVRATGSNDFWKLSRTRSLRPETRHYVPKLLAAAKVTKEPERYGFTDVEYLPRLEWQVLSVTVAVDLGAVAKACGDPDNERLKLLNPELRIGVTPPGRVYPLRVPAGHLELCKHGMAAVPEKDRVSYRYHEIKAQDSLQSLAKKYLTTAQAILQFNEINEEQLHDYEEIVVPVPYLAARGIGIVEPGDRKFRGSSYGPDGLSLVLHQVQAGDNLWRIARKYRVQVQKLRLWNGLWKAPHLRVGQVLKVYVGQGGAPSRRKGR